MDVHLGPETESRLLELAAETWRPRGESVEDAIAVSKELAGMRQTLDGRYDDIKTGK